MIASWHISSHMFLHIRAPSRHHLPVEPFPRTGAVSFPSWQTQSSQVWQTSGLVSCLCLSHRLWEADSMLLAALLFGSCWECGGPGGLVWTVEWVLILMGKSVGQCNPHSRDMAWHAVSCVGWVVAAGLPAWCAGEVQLLEKLGAGLKLHSGHAGLLGRVGIQEQLFAENAWPRPVTGRREPGPGHPCISHLGKCCVPFGKMWLALLWSEPEHTDGSRLASIKQPV